MRVVGLVETRYFSLKCVLEYFLVVLSCLSNLSVIQAFRKRSSDDWWDRFSLFASSSNESGWVTRESNNWNSTAVNNIFDWRYPSIREKIWFGSGCSWLITEL